MTTLTKSYGRFDTQTQNLTLFSRYNTFIQKLEPSYYGIISMAILISSCLGAITTMQIFENDSPLWQFILSLAFTMGNLVACIGQAPTKWVINLFTASILANVLLLLMNLN